MTTAKTSTFWIYRRDADGRWRPWEAPTLPWETEAAAVAYAKKHLGTNWNVRPQGARYSEAQPQDTEAAPDFGLAIAHGARSVVEPIHSDCVVCQARSTDFDEPGDETVVILVLLLSGSTVDDTIEVRRWLADRIDPGTEVGLAVVDGCLVKSLNGNEMPCSREISVIFALQVLRHGARGPACRHPDPARPEPLAEGSTP